MSTIRVLVGTKKGAFILTSDGKRKQWNVTGPHFGGWELFQELLRALRQIADEHSTDIASIASRYVLDLPAVAAVIVGATNRSHLISNAAMSAIQLTPQDRDGIAAILSHRRGPAGDTFALERDRDGPHGSIMKYNLNRAPA